MFRGTHGPQGFGQNTGNNKLFNSIKINKDEFIQHQHQANGEAGRAPEQKGTYVTHTFNHSIERVLSPVP